MQPVSDLVKKFFEDYERDVDASDPELVASRYHDPFVFAGPQGMQIVKKDDFLKALPRRQSFFKTVGLTSSRIQSLEETRLDDCYVMVKAYWSMRFEKCPEQPIVDETSATYILDRRGDSLRIVFQLDHQDLVKRVQDLGLSSATG
jgi:hypothetical protein